MPRYRLYFNNSADRQHWSIDEGTADTEVCVLGVHLDGICALTRFDAVGTGQPRAWLEFSAEPPVIIGGVARFL
jgi:hypothetical protein